MSAGAADEGFRVTDRRRRDEREARGPAPAPPAPGPVPAPPEAGPRAATRDASDAASLVGLFVMLANTAALSLGDEPDPVTGRPERDLEQASELIDVLVLLRAKTEGHRTLEESQVLDDVIYELQVRYAAATGRA